MPLLTMGRLFASNCIEGMVVSEAYASEPACLI